MKTKEELKEEKALLMSKYGTVYTIEDIPINDEGDTATIYLKKMDRILYSMMQKLTTGNDFLIAVEAFINGTYIGGDDKELILKCDEALMSCDQPIVQLMSGYKAKLKKN